MCFMFYILYLFSGLVDALKDKRVRKRRCKCGRKRDKKKSRENKRNNKTISKKNVYYVSINLEVAQNLFLRPIVFFLFLFSTVWQCASFLFVNFPAKFSYFHLKFSGKCSVYRETFCMRFRPDIRTPLKRNS